MDVNGKNSNAHSASSMSNYVVSTPAAAAAVAVTRLVGRIGRGARVWLTQLLANTTQLLKEHGENANTGG